MCLFSCNRTCLKAFFNLLALLILVSGTNIHTSAQEMLTTLCASFDATEISIPSPFPGIYYRATSGNKPEEILYKFERLDESGMTELVAPLSPEQTRTLGMPLVSPGGRYMAFRTFSPETPLTIWKIGTNELATISLRSEEYEYFRDEEAITYDKFFDKLVWQDNNHLVIQYFDKKSVLSTQFKRLIAQTEITVSENPLRLFKGIKQEILYPTLPSPSGDGFVGGVYFSPRRTYATLVSLQLVRLVGDFPRLQIYNTRTNQLVFDREPRRNNNPFSLPIWNRDETIFFYEREVNYLPVKLVQVNVNKGFVEDSYLQQTLDSAFGSDTSLDLFKPIFDKKSNRLALHIYSPIQQKFYLIIYMLDTRRVTAICDPFVGSRDHIIPIWVPGEKYFAYSIGEVVVAFHLETGKVYQLPGDYAGWAEVIPSKDV